MLLRKQVVLEKETFTSIINPDNQKWALDVKGLCLDEVIFNFTVVAFQTDTMKPRQELAIFFIFLLSTSALARDLPAKHRQTQLQQVRNQLLETLDVSFSFTQAVSIEIASPSGAFLNRSNYLTWSNIAHN